MTINDKIDMVKTLVDGDAEATDSLVTVLLQLAEDSILARLFPFGVPEEGYTVPAQYDMLQVKLAQRYFLRRGAEGETLHIENGIHRDYETADDDDLLKNVTPYIRVV